MVGLQAPKVSHILWVDTTDLSDHGSAVGLQAPKVWLWSMAKFHSHEILCSARKKFLEGNRKVMSRISHLQDYIYSYLLGKIFVMVWHYIMPVRYGRSYFILQIYCDIYYDKKYSGKS